MTSDLDEKTSRRAYRRVRLALQVSYRGTGSFLVSYSLDLSRGGLFIETAEPSPVGTELELKLDVPGVTQEITLRGVVMWVQAGWEGGHAPGMGIQFHDPESSMGDLIDSLVRQFDGLRILVASTSPRLRTQLVRMIRSVMTATLEEHDLVAPLPSFSESRYDLLVVDLGESEGRAIEVVRQLRSEGLPTAVVAIGADARARQDAKQSGADEVVVGPAAAAELRAAVIRALARPILLRSSATGGE